jgi:hypothetical protein
MNASLMVDTHSRAAPPRRAGAWTGIPGADGTRGNDWRRMSIVAAIGIGALGLAATMIMRERRNRRSHQMRDAPPQEREEAIEVTAGRRLNRAAGILAFSVLTDSAMEHYRGSFENRAMYTPLVAASLGLAVSMHGLADSRGNRNGFRHAVYVLNALTGLVGLGFHAYNVGKRPGGVSWLNLFYGAPIGAPAALILSGALGFSAERVRDNQPGAAPELFGLPAGRTLAFMTAAGLLGTVGEAGLLHFRGAFHNPLMLLPVTVPPVAAGLLASTAVGPTRRHRRLTRLALEGTTVLGLGGVGLHAYGVQRNMGGWYNWSQNLLNGPPLPAPPSFTGLALAGLAALSLMEDHPNA